MMSPTDKQLVRFMDTDWGYGNWSASYWFVGMEEGGGDSWTAICDRLRSWEGLGAPQMAPFRPRNTGRRESVVRYQRSHPTLLG
jgi:hypothetical protein